MPGPYEPVEDDNASSGEVIFEIIRMGSLQRIAAIDVASGVEVVVQAPASLSASDARALALRKLKWRLSKDDAS